MAFAHSVKTTIEDFSRAMGLEPMQADDGTYSFDFERGGRVSVIAADDGSILISLTRRLLVEDARNLALCVGLSGVDPYNGMTCHAGLNKAGQPVLTLRVPEAGLDVPAIEAAYLQLNEKFQSIGF